MSLLSLRRRRHGQGQRARLACGGVATLGANAALLALLTLGAACGGEVGSNDVPAADSPAHSTAAGAPASGPAGSAAAAGAAGESSSADANAAADPDATDAQGSANDRSERCASEAAAALLLVQQAEAAAPRACTRDSDCIIFNANPRCLYGCGYTATVTDPSSLDAVFTRIEAMCRAECEPVPPPPCVAQGEAFTACLAGECQLQFSEP